MSSLPAHLRRHFLAWDRPWLTQVTAWLAGDWQGGGPLDLSRTVALVPTRQSGRRLREALASLAAEHDAGVFPPRVMTPDAWLRGEIPADVATPAQAVLAWAEVFQTIELETVRAVFPIDPPARDFGWALQLAKAFERLERTLANAGFTFADVSATLGEDAFEVERWSQIALLQRAHEARLLARGWRAPEPALIQAARRTDFDAGVDRIVVLGVSDLPALAIARLTAAAATLPVDIVVSAPETEAAAFDGFGRPLPTALENRVIEVPDFEARVHLCADPADQARRIARLAARFPTPEGALALGFADPEITPLAENELRRVGRAAFNPEGRLRRSEGFCELLANLAALARDPTFAAIESLARCPDVLACLQRRDASFSASRWLRALDRLRADHLPADLAAAAAFARTADSPQLADGLGWMAELRKRLTRGRFAGGVEAVLHDLFAERWLNLERTEDAALHEAAAAWMELLRECAEMEPHFATLDRDAWWDFSLRLFGERRADAGDRPPGALDLQGWLELLWEDAPHLVVAGFNDGRVPESVTDDAFLPGSLRQRLGLDTNAARFARDAYILQAILQSRDRVGRVDLLLGKTTAAAEPLRPSRLLLQCAEGELAPRVEFLFRPVALPAANDAWTRAWKLTPRLAPPPARVAVTALRRYLACPFRFYLRNVLKMDSVDPLKSELDAFDFGTLCHAALEQIGREPRLRDCTDPAQLRNELWRHLDRQVTERYGAVLSLPLLVQAESARQRLAKLAELQAAERAAGWEIIHVEREFALEIAGVVVRGKIDRIDRHAVTGEVRVLDYKTSDTPVTPAAAHLRPVRPGEVLPPWTQFDYEGRRCVFIDLQLPLYLRAMATEFPGRVACGYFNLPKAAGETVLAWWEGYTADLHAAAMHCAEAACAAIGRGEFWPPNGTLRAERDECAALFHQGVEASVSWPPLLAVVASGGPAVPR